MSYSSEITLLKNQMHKNTNEVSYAFIDISQNKDDNPFDRLLEERTFEQISAAVNVRLLLTNNLTFPYIESDNFNSLANNDKVFLYGPSGCGKSRALFEIVKNNINSAKRICVINPRNVVDLVIRRDPLVEIVSMFSENDIIVWDNFPDDLLRRDSKNLRRVLELLGYRNVRKLVVALKPKYLEVFKNLARRIPEFYSTEVSYGKDSFKLMVKVYGTNIFQFNNIYNKYISKDLEKISNILWRKEPTPLTILDYYNEMIINDEKYNENKVKILSDNSKNIHYSNHHPLLNGIVQAEKLLRSTNYYEHQFALLTNLHNRQIDVDFLYVLKICYELGLGRTEKNINSLQQAIFETSSPKVPEDKLGNWLYIIGQQYAIHDVCRESIKLKDNVIHRILTCISNNFDEMVPTDTSQTNRFGLFLGQHIEFLLEDLSLDHFLPDGIYSFMKNNPSFEKAVGHGAGKVFATLENQFRETLLVKSDTEIEFGAGLAESLGLVYPSLDYDQREMLLHKTYDGMLFARFFGQSLGRYLKDLDNDIRQEIFVHSEVNPQFADGIGIGLGQEFEFLSNEFKKDIILRASESPDITRGLGCGFALATPSLNDTQIKAIFTKAETNNEFDLGLGMGFATLYSSLNINSKINILKRCNTFIEFSYGFGIYSAYFVPWGCPTELLPMMKKNISFAIGLGAGFGVKFLYLPEEFQTFLLEESKVNTVLDFGLGFGSGMIYRYLPPGIQDRFFDTGNNQNEFDKGLGFGIGWTWVYLCPENKNQAFSRCKTNCGFSYGLGVGQGYLFKCLSDEEIKNIFIKADDDAQFDNGLGFGLGESFLNIGKQLQDKALNRCMANNFFAFGLSSGLGMIFSYLSSQLQEDSFSRSLENGWFAKGLGYGIGRYSLSYFDSTLRSKIFSKIKENLNFATGLGEGIGSSFSFYKELQMEEIPSKISNKNPFYTRGLGIGLGKSFEYLSQTQRDDVFRLAKKDTYFATGLGEGIGFIFGYLGPTSRNDILNKTFNFADSGFTKGFAVGLGINFTYLEKSISNIITSRVDDIQFSIGIGKGMGYVYKYFSQSKKKSLFLQAADNRYFAVGLGEGIGNVLQYLDKDLKNKVMEQASGNKEFAIGLGIGMELAHSKIELKLNEIISSSTTLNENIAKGLGVSFGVLYPFLQQKFQDKLVKALEKNRSFAKEVGRGVGHMYSYLNHNNDTLDDYDQLITKNTPFAFGFGLELGYNFPFLNVRIQEKILYSIKQFKYLGCGFGFGLSKFFGHIDIITGQEILRQGIEDNSAFSYNLGCGLGINFPSINEIMQKKIIDIAEIDCLFSSGFIKSIVDNFVYLDSDLQWKISKVIEKHGSNSTVINVNSQKYPEVVDYYHIDNLKKDEPYYHYFPFLGSSDITTTSNWITEIDEELVFSGKQNRYCVGYIDMMNSTKIASKLENIQLSKYYSIFLNAMATIIRNFGGKIVKNAGDALIFYFPDTANLHLRDKLEVVLKCGVAMISAYGIINAEMHKQGLPPVNYRISIDYGLVEMATSKSSQIEDLFGSAMNICAKINGKALANGMIIGEELFNVMEDTFNDDYFVKPAGVVVLGLAEKEKYSIYHIESKIKNTLNPFRYKINE